MQDGQPITVELDEERASLERHLASGHYGSPSDVLKAGLRALDREQAEFEQSLSERLRSPGRKRAEARPAAEVLDRLRAHHLECWGKMPDEG